MEPTTNIIPLTTSPALATPTAVRQVGTPSNIQVHTSSLYRNTVYRLVNAEELAEAAKERLAIKLNRSLLCQFRDDGMPSVRFSERRIRYDLAACLEWLILRSFRNGHNQRMDPVKLLSDFGLNPAPNGAA